MSPNIVELDGKIFVPADRETIPEWPCVLNEEPQPTLTIKDHDMFLVSDI